MEKRLEEENYVGTYHGNIERFEEHLSSIGFRRNPLAWLRRDENHGFAEATWVKRKTLFSEKQLHVFLQSCHNNKKTRIYTHREDNWARHPIRHLMEVNVDSDEGKRLMMELMKQEVPENRVTYY